MIESSLDEAGVLEQIQYQMQDYPKLLKIINTLLPPECHLQQVNN